MTRILRQITNFRGKRLLIGLTVAASIAVTTAGAPATHAAAGAPTTQAAGTRAIICAICHNPTLTTNGFQFIAGQWTVSFVGQNYTPGGEVAIYGWLQLHGNGILVHTPVLYTTASRSLILCTSHGCRMLNPGGDIAFSLTFPVGRACSSEAPFDGYDVGSGKWSAATTC